MGDIVPDVWIVSVQSVMSLLQAELDRLIAQKTELERRRRSLYRRLDTLLEGPSRRRPYGVGALKSSRLCAHPRYASESARDSWRVHNELRRACRIALMEAGGTATADEIYSHIVRRDSFCFTSLKEPIPAIVRTLSLMAEAGEASRMTGAPDSWQLMKQQELFRPR